MLPHTLSLSLPLSYAREKERERYGCKCWRSGWNQTRAGVEGGGQRSKKGERKNAERRSGTGKGKERERDGEKMGGETRRERYTGWDR